MGETRSRKWLITINNPEKYAMSHEQIKATLNTIKNIDYWCISDEIGENGTYHTHLYIYSPNPKNFSTLKNKFPHARLDNCRGTHEDCRNYVFKLGKWEKDKKAETNLPDTHEESGELPFERQGARNDLDELYAMIKTGLSNYEILESNPNYITQIERIDKVRLEILGEEYRHKFRQLEVTYMYGPPGCGKTRNVFESEKDLYRISNYDHPFDSYNGESVVFFDEFRSNIRISDMLNYLDGYPLKLPCRYNDRQACYTKVYIASNLRLEEQYKTIQQEQKETWNALLRRINYVITWSEDGTTEMKFAKDYMESIKPKRPSLSSFHAAEPEQLVFT